MTKDAIKEDANKLRNAVKTKDKDRPIREGLKFLADNGKFKKNHEAIGKELLSKGPLSLEELKLAKKILTDHGGELDPKLYLDILNYKTEKQVKERSSSKAIESLTGQFFSTPQGLKFYVEAEGMPIEIESESFEGLISDRKYKAGEGLPSGDEIASIRRLARYWASKDLREIGVRNAKFKDGIIYDPVRPDGKVYFITREGYVLKTPDQPYTVRYTGMLEAAVEDGTLQDHLDLIRLWQLDSKSEILSMGLDFSRFIPDIPHAIENIDGPHGSGKTSYTETHRSVFDPNGAPTQSLKFDERDLSISAVHQGMLAFDNVNAALPDYISDIVCRLTTGQGFRTRELYTNTGEIILKLKRSIIINGINRASYKPDFIDRECPIHLGVMPESRRLTDTDIRAKAESLVPKVRGYLISIIPRAMELYPQVESELKGKLPRMADFVIWGECGIRAMGFPAMSFYNAYMEAKHEETVDVARDTLIISAIQSLMANREEWKGTTKDLLDTLESFVTENQRKSKAFPKDERRLGRVLRELIPTLQEIGLEIADLKNNKHEKKISKIGKTYEVNSTNSTNQTGPTNNGFSENENNKNTDLGNSLIASKAEPENHDVQNESAISAINYHESGNNKDVKTNTKLKADPLNSEILKKHEGDNGDISAIDEHTIKRIGETYKVNVSNVKNEFEPTKYSFGETDNNEKTDFKKTSNVSEAEAVNDRMESKNDITDINYHESGNGDLKKDKLKKDEERARAYIENLKKQWAENPRKALFNFIEMEAPKTKYRSMTPKAILDMLPVPDVELSYIVGLCEELSREGAFIKNRGGAYSVNPEFLNGGEYQ